MTRNLEHIVSRYDALIVDLWGVIHDGSALYPGVAEAMRFLAEQGKRVVFLSNAPRVAAKARATLKVLGISDAWYHGIVTSGQVAHDMLAQEVAPRRYYYLGPSKDEDVLSDLAHMTRVRNASEAEFILNAGYEYDGQPHEDILPVLKTLLPLPLLCINPDLEVVKQDGTQILCAGAVAAAYAAMGGPVEYLGKPYPEVYRACQSLLGNDAGRLLCVGDNPATDILGANRSGLDSLLIAGGILSIRDGAAMTEEKLAQNCRAAGAAPTYILPGFSLLS